MHYALRLSVTPEFCSGLFLQGPDFDFSSVLLFVYYYLKLKMVEYIICVISISNIEHFIIYEHIIISIQFIISKQSFFNTFWSNFTNVPPFFGCVPRAGWPIKNQADPPLVPGKPI